MRDEFKEVAERVADRWKRHRERWRADANVPLAMRERLDALVEAMPEPVRDGWAPFTIAECNFRAGDAVRISPASGLAHKGHDGLLMGQAIETIYANQQTDIDSKRGLVRVHRDPRDELCEAAVGFVDERKQLSFSLRADETATIVTEQNDWVRLHNAVEAYKKGK
jgi:hypothetical protein